MTKSQQIDQLNNFIALQKSMWWLLMVNFVITAALIAGITWVYDLHVAVISTGLLTLFAAGWRSYQISQLVKKLKVLMNE